MDASNTRERSEVSQDRLRSCGKDTNRQTDRQVCFDRPLRYRKAGSRVGKSQKQETETIKSIKTSIKIVGVVAFILWGIWITCFDYKGESTNERWEWAIGTNERTDHWHEEP